MFKFMSRAACRLYQQAPSYDLPKTIIGSKNLILQPCKSFSVLQNNQANLKTFEFKKPVIKDLILVPNFQGILGTFQSRDVTKFSLKKGKRKSVKAVLQRFYRLNWGGWIRTRAGKHKHLWKKSSALRKRLKEHVLCNGTQNWLLDSMVTNYWRKPKYYVDDPYEPYHKREEYCKTRVKPFRPNN